MKNEENNQELDDKNPDLKNETPTEEVKVEINTQENFSPFDEPVVERDYTKPNVDASMLEDEIAEPTFEAPVFVEEEEPEDEIEREPINPSYNELDEKEKDAGAEMMTEIVIDGYAKLKSLAGGLAKIKESKLEKEFAEGTIDPNLPVPIDTQGNTASIIDYVQEFNQTTQEACETSEQFKDTVRPVLERVLKKRGVGMTDEQFLLYQFGTDALSFGVQIFSLKKSAQQVVNSFREQTDYMKAQQYANQPNQDPTPQAQSKTEPNLDNPSYVEPEEELSEPQANPNPINQEPAQEIVNNDSGMPEFGNEADLQKMEEIASGKTVSKSNSKNKSLTKTNTSDSKPTPSRRGRPRKKDK